MEIEVIIFYLLLLDAVIANIISWFGRNWYREHFWGFARLFPLTKGWTFYYLVLVLWAGSFLYRAGMINF